MAWARIWARPPGHIKVAKDLGDSGQFQKTGKQPAKMLNAKQNKPTGTSQLSSDL